MPGAAGTRVWEKAMTSIEHQIEQHILEHESRLRHTDELLQRARTAAAGAPQQPEARTELEGLERRRDALAEQIEELRSRPLEDWREEEIEQSGPMGIWDAVAQQIERLVERLER